MRDTLKEALAALTVLDVAAALGDDLESGMNLSPMRDEKTPSFHVFDNDKKWRDFGSGSSGGTWLYVEARRPDWSKAEVAHFLKQTAGVDESEPPKISKTEMRDRARRERIKAYEARRAGYRSKAFEHSAAWDPRVAAYFADGILAALSDGERLEKFCESRGWPAYWGEQLAEIGKMGFPAEPWSDKKQLAFVVEKPVFETATAGGLEPVGYHQRFFDAKTGRKAYVYVPHKPNRPRTDFQTVLSKLGQTCNPYPFVLGDLDKPEVVVITEGQFDAITFWGAAGYFDERWPIDKIAVFGLRGSQGTDAFFASYGGWLKACAPAVWVISDNDPSGSSWREDKTDRQGRVRPSLVNRIRALRIPRVVSSWFGAVKDFNDAYKATPAAFTPLRIYQLMKDLNLLTY